MNTISTLAAAISVAGAVVTVGLGAWFEHRRNTSRRRAQLRHRASRYNETLLKAADSVRARLGNVPQIPKFREADRFRDYAIFETAYRIGRYLCVVHIVSQEVRFLDLGNRRRNQKLVERLGAVRGVLNDYGTKYGTSFLLLGGEQEAIGELFVDTTPTGDGPPRCISYPVFRERFETDERFARWLRPLVGEIEELVDGGEVPARFADVRTALDELVEFLDRRRIWQPWNVGESRRLAAAATSPDGQDKPA